MQKSIQNILRSDTNLSIRFLELQLIECLFARVNTRKIEIDSIENLIIGNATFHNIVVGMWQTLATQCHKIESLAIVRSENLREQSGKSSSNR